MSGFLATFRHGICSFVWSDFFRRQRPHMRAVLPCIDAALNQTWKVQAVFFKLNCSWQFLFNRSSCVTVQSDDICPVSWNLPPEYALNYKTEVETIRLDQQILDKLYVSRRCKSVISKTLCTQLTPKCLSDGGKDYGVDARTQCQEIYDTSTCPSNLANAYKRQRFCEKNPTGKHEKAACVAPDKHIDGICPQPEYKWEIWHNWVYKSEYKNVVWSFIQFPKWRHVDYR